MLCLLVVAAFSLSKERKIRDDEEPVYNSVPADFARDAHRVNLVLHGLLFVCQITFVVCLIVAIVQCIMRCCGCRKPAAPATNDDDAMPPIVSQSPHTAPTSGYPQPVAAAAYAQQYNHVPHQPPQAWVPQQPAQPTGRFGPAPYVYYQPPPNHNQRYARV
jgi:hypothetical protein